MRILLLTLSLLLVWKVKAQPYNDKRFRISTGFTVNPTLGPQHHRTSDHFLYGKSRAGIGISLVVAKPIYKGFMLGFNIGTTAHTMVENAVKEQLRRRYAPAGYFVTSSANNLNYNITMVGLEYAKNFDFKGGCFVPFLRTNLARGNSTAELDIRLKQKNDNYFKQYSLRGVLAGVEDFTSFLPVIGVKLEARLSNYVYLQGACSYTTGNLKMGFLENSNDLFGKYESKIVTMQQPISMLDFYLGIQVRFGR